MILSQLIEPGCANIYRMTNIDSYWTHPIFDDSGVEANEGYRLFKAGDPVDSMFILLSGTVQLLVSKDDKEYLVSFLGPGQFLGEHILIGAHGRKRAFTARAHTKIRALWVDRGLALRIQTQEPALMIDLLKTIFQVASTRLDGTNYLLQHFRNNHKEERFLYLVKYLVQSTGRKHRSGTEVYLPPELILYYIDLDVKEVEKGLWELQRQGLMALIGPYTYVVRDKQKLFDLTINDDGVDSIFLG